MIKRTQKKIYKIIYDAFTLSGYCQNYIETIKKNIA